jgi:hypothetical protein
VGEIAAQAVPGRDATSEGCRQAAGELTGGLEQSHSTHSDLLKKSNRFEWIWSKDILPMLQNFQIKYGFVAN